MQVFTLFLILLASLCLGACAPLQLEDTFHLNSSSYLEYSPNGNYDLPEGQVYKPFPDDDNQIVRNWITHYSIGKGRSKMQECIRRSTFYINMMQELFGTAGMPEDLLYVSMVESEFNPFAVSNKKAVGCWQFIYGTGVRFGLTINKYVDERRDCEASTMASIKYHQFLYHLFGDWLLVMAAYNWGEANVKAAIRRHKSTDFWYLVSKGAFPKETRNHVPQIIAMRKIATRPWDYGFYELRYQKPMDYELVYFSGASYLSRLSDQLGVPLSVLKQLNPKFKTDYVPATEEKTYIRVPVGTVI